MDLSEGGCFVEMPIPLKVNTGLEIVLWLADTKLRVKGEVATSAPGFGIGIRFISLSPESRSVLQRHVGTWVK